MHLQTHLSIDTDLCGQITKLEKNYAEVTLHTRGVMAADEYGLIHGGYIFSAADFAAMAAVNEPYVVLSAAEVRFIAPVKKGDTVICRAKIVKSERKKHFIDVVASVENREVFKGTFQAVVLKKHVLN